MKTEGKCKGSTPVARRKRAVESFQSAAECLGKIEKGMSLFAVTRGQWSMLDAILAVLEQIGPAELSVWTWTVAEYEVEVMERLMMDRRLRCGRLVIDHGARWKNLAILEKWQARFGADSVRLVVNHAKIATIRTAELKFLLRGSMNLNFNPRFEQFDITEGDEGFDLVKRIEDELPVLEFGCGGGEPYRASKLDKAFDLKTLELFQGIKVWRPK